MKNNGVFLFDVVKEIGKIIQTRISAYSYVQAEHSPMIFLSNLSDTSITSYSHPPTHPVLIYPYLSIYTTTSPFLVLYLYVALEKETIYFLSNLPPQESELGEKQWLRFIHCCISSPRNKFCI